MKNFMFVVCLFSLLTFGCDRPQPVVQQVPVQPVMQPVIADYDDDDHFTHHKHHKTVIINKTITVNQVRPGATPPPAPPASPASNSIANAQKISPITGLPVVKNTSMPSKPTSSSSARTYGSSSFKAFNKK